MRSLATGALLLVGASSAGCVFLGDPDRSGWRLEAPAMRGLRPLDSSDPEMAAIARAARAAAPCETAPEVPCEERREPIRRGGERLAGYLVRQFEAGIEEGWFPDYGLLTLVARTESERGLEYLEGLVRQPERVVDAPNALTTRRYALRALAEVHDERAVDIGLWALRHEKDVQNRGYALLAVSRNLLALELRRPDAVARIRALASNPATAPALTRQAEQQLETLAGAGLAGPLTPGVGSK